VSVQVRAQSPFFAEQTAASRRVEGKAAKAKADSNANASTQTQTRTQTLQLTFFTLILSSAYHRRAKMGFCCRIKIPIPSFSIFLYIFISAYLDINPLSPFSLSVYLCIFLFCSFSRYHAFLQTVSNRASGAKWLCRLF